MVDELYRLYIVPWASAWGAFAFQSGPYMRGVQVSSGLRPCVGLYGAISGPFLIG